MAKEIAIFWSWVYFSVMKSFRSVTVVSIELKAVLGALTIKLHETWLSREFPDLPTTSRRCSSYNCNRVESNFSVRRKPSHPMPFGKLMNSKLQSHTLLCSLLHLRKIKTFIRYIATRISIFDCKEKLIRWHFLGMFHYIHN